TRAAQSSERPSRPGVARASSPCPRIPRAGCPCHGGMRGVVPGRAESRTRIRPLHHASASMPNSLIEKYFQIKDPTTIPPGFLAYLAGLECVARVAPEVARSIVQELADQRRNIKLIASENYSSLATQCAMGNLLTDKYAEGIPHHRFYAGCENVDAIEDLANTRARELFGAAHAYAQPHSGADANLVAFWAVLRARVELGAIAKLTGAEGPEAVAPGDWYKLTPDQWGGVRQAIGN